MSQSRLHRYTHTSFNVGKILCAAVLAGGLFFSSACAKKEKPKPKPPVPVITTIAEQKTVPVQLNAIGNVDAYSFVQINTRVGGHLSRVLIREGQHVNKGDLLFVIDPKPFEAALRQAEANLGKDKAQMENAKQQARRYEQLVQKGYVAQAEYDQMRTNADALEATVNADKAAVETAKLNVNYCYIHAPISGRTGSLQVYQGNLVKADDKTIVTINQVQPIYVNFSVPEMYLDEIRNYMAKGNLKITASFSAEGNQKNATGTLTFVDNAVDKTTGTIRLKATFPNKDNLLWPGQFVSVTVQLTNKQNAVTVPSQAVQTGQQGQYVFVIKQDSTAEIRPVSTSIVYGNETVIDKGVQPGERVVTDGQLRLVPGAKVAIKTGISPAGAGK